MTDVLHRLFLCSARAVPDAVDVDVVQDDVPIIIGHLHDVDATGIGYDIC